MQELPQGHLYRKVFIKLDWTNLQRDMDYKRRQKLKSNPDLRRPRPHRDAVPLQTQARGRNSNHGVRRQDNRFRQLRESLLDDDSQDSTIQDAEDNDISAIIQGGH